MSKKKQKVFVSIIFFIFLLLFSYFFWGEYIAFHKELKLQEIKKDNILKEINSFSLEKLDVLENVELKNTPSKEVLNLILSKIKNAKNRIYIETYIFTHKQIRQALKEAYKKGIDIKVLLEKKPYLAPNLNKKTFDILKNTWINVLWSNSKSFYLNHSKLIIIDDEIILSTWNLSYSNFAYNRDLFLFIKDKKILNVLINIFNNDFLWKKALFYNSNLILSPDYSRYKIEYLLNSAKKDIKMCFPYIKDSRLEEILFNQAKKGIEIKLIVSYDTFKKDKEKIDLLNKKWIKIGVLKKPKLHSKSILVDNKYLYIWSINFSNYSMDKNRELWLILINENIINFYLKLFNHDFIENNIY